MKVQVHNRFLQPAAMLLEYVDISEADRKVKLVGYSSKELVLT